MPVAPRPGGRGLPGVDTAGDGLGGRSLRGAGRAGVPGGSPVL